MDPTPDYGPSYGEPSRQRYTSDDASPFPPIPVEDSGSQLWPTGHVIPEHLIDPNLGASPNAPSTYLNELATYQSEGQAARIHDNHNSAGEQGDRCLTNGLRGAQEPFQAMTGQETSKETYFGPQAAIARTDDQAGPFHWNQNHSPVHIRVPSLYTEENNDSAGLGTMFPPGDHVLKQSVDDADLGNVDLDALKPQHLQTQILSFRRSDDYSSLGTYDENGFAKEISVPGAGSNLTSQSEADASVDGGKFACSDCGKTYMLESRLRKHKASHLPGFKESREFRCDTCGSTSRYPKDLKRHKRQHNPIPIKPFKCTFNDCFHHQEGFGRRDHLIRHLRKQHDGAELPC